MSLDRPTAPPAVRWIARTLEDAGFETWAVGGAVRDALRKRPSGDWDLATLARPGDMRRLFRRTVPIGIEHGTVGILARDGTMYEVTTFRKDVETDGRHAVVAFADRLEDDLARRDFTVNAIAWHPIRDEFFDPYGGMQDLEDRLLRTVGVPAERFAEDYLRVLRALRFGGRFAFRIDEGTWSAMCAVTDRLDGLSAERVREELIKVLYADPAPSASLGLYRTCGALEVVFPELAALSDDVWSQTLKIVDHLPAQRPFQRLAALLRPVERDDAARLLLRMRLSNAQVDETALRASAARLPAANADDAAFRRWLSREGPGRVSALARLEVAEARTGRGSPAGEVASWRSARRVRAARPPLAVGDLDSDGRDLMRLGLRPGPQFGQILERLLEWVLDDPTRNRAEALEAQVARITDALDEKADG